MDTIVEDWKSTRQEYRNKRGIGRVVKGNRKGGIDSTGRRKEWKKLRKGCLWLMEREEHEGGKEGKGKRIRLVTAMGREGGMCRFKGEREGGKKEGKEGCVCFREY